MRFAGIFVRLRVFFIPSYCSNLRQKGYEALYLHEILGCSVNPKWDRHIGKSDSTAENRL